MKVPEIWVSFNDRFLSDDGIKKLIQYNVACIRINTGRGSYLWAYDTISRLTRSGYPANKILLDIGNKKPRVVLANSNEALSFTKGSLLTLSKIPLPDTDMSLSNEAFFEVVKKDDVLYFGDGENECTIQSIDSGKLKLLPHSDGVLRNYAPVGIKTKELVHFCVDDNEIYEVNQILSEHSVGLLLSFVEIEDNIIWAKNAFLKAACIVPKIEVLNAVDNIKSILRQSEMILIGRGDLSLSVGIEKIGIIQQKLIRAAHKKKRKVVVGTGTLVSLLWNEVPLSAEIIDITNSCVEGVDAILLTTETASVKDPFKAIETLKKTINYIGTEGKNRVPFCNLREVDI